MRSRTSKSLLKYSCTSASETCDPNGVTLYVICSDLSSSEIFMIWSLDPEEPPICSLPGPGTTPSYGFGIGVGPGCLSWYKFSAGSFATLLAGGPLPFFVSVAPATCAAPSSPNISTSPVPSPSDASASCSPPSSKSPGKSSISSMRLACIMPKLLTARGWKNPIKGQYPCCGSCWSRNEYSGGHSTRHTSSPTHSTSSTQPFVKTLQLRSGSNVPSSKTSTLGADTMCSFHAPAESSCCIVARVSVHMLRQ
mmetsp:Transcript_16260/g.40113  ORF Transcript_16260/g.40113 Transcript_16260/m.40113 type:complete len:252 (+) Transcript_16260:148-903(+)